MFCYQTSLVINSEHPVCFIKLCTLDQKNFCEEIKTYHYPFLY